MTLALRGGVSWAQTQDGLALLDDRRGLVWTLNPTGAQVLRALLSGHTPEQAVRELAAEYGVVVSSVRRDVQELLVGLFASGVLVRGKSSGDDA
ncbi:lasso peptide biosynthesis PqqD family chaperone [Streptomyces sannanensis]